MRLSPIFKILFHLYRHRYHDFTREPYSHIIKKLPYDDFDRRFRHYYGLFLLRKIVRYKIHLESIAEHMNKSRSTIYKSLFYGKGSIVFYQNLEEQLKKFKHRRKEKQ